MTHQENLIAAAKAEDLYNLQQHIAWTDTIKPKLQQQVTQYSQMLVSHALGGQLPAGKTREQIAGMAYGIQYVISLFERVLKDGERAINALAEEGITINNLER